MPNLTPDYGTIFSTWRNFVILGLDAKVMNYFIFLVIFEELLDTAMRLKLPKAEGQGIKIKYLFYT
jgi:hypothetical protein